MKHILRFAIVMALLTVMQYNFGQKTIACGPSYLTPVFDYTYAPERPWTDFASGKLGIVKPTYRRAVLFAAYRYLNNNGFSEPEQRAVIEMWEGLFNRIDPADKTVNVAIDEWIKARKNVVGQEENTPKIYADRVIGETYNSFPNCSTNAFEVAKKTLEDRSLMYGSDSKDVREWIAGQDRVFEFCSEGTETPSALAEDAAVWLQKDRAYQWAAADFYRGNYADARNKFVEIAQDYESPWRETADYLVARTLVRIASDGETENEYVSKNSQTEEYIGNLLNRTNQYQNATRRLQNLIKYRLHPKERALELGQRLTYQNDPAELRQDLIDYTWLLDQLESEALKKSEQEKEAREKATATPTPGIPSPETLRSVMNANVAPVSTPEYSAPSGYNGGYYGSAEASFALVPDFLKNDPLSEWLFTYQLQTDDAYFHAINRWQGTSSDMWLMTAMTKAKKDLAGFKELMEASKFTSPSSPAYYTIAYHRIRLLMEINGQDEARKALDAILKAGDEMPISTRNLFIEQRLKLSQNIDELLKFSIRKPFGFSFEDDTARSIDEIIADRKSWYNPEHWDVSQAQYDADIDKEYAEKRMWTDRGFFDEKALDVINEYFPTAQLMELIKNPQLPSHLKRRLIIAVWTRAYLLKDNSVAAAIAPEVVKLKPNVEPMMTAYLTARTPAEKDIAGLFLILKDGEFSPYISGGFDYEAQEEVDIWVDERWWCEQYDTGYDNHGNERDKASYFVPPFLPPTTMAQAKRERTDLKKTNDAVSYLTNRVIAWAGTANTDKRLPEALYVIFQSNQWVKYGCGQVQDGMREKTLNMLRTRFPRSQWTQKAITDMAENEQ